MVFALAVIVIVLSSGGGDDGGGGGAGTDSSTSAGQTATAPSPATRKRARGSAYTVKPGDTLGSIAEKSGVEVERLQELNPELDPQALVAGQKVKLRE